MVHFRVSKLGVREGCNWVALDKHPGIDAIKVRKKKPVQHFPKSPSLLVPLGFYGIYLWSLHEIYGISGKFRKNPATNRPPIKSIGIFHNIGEVGLIKGGFPKMVHRLKNERAR